MLKETISLDYYKYWYLCYYSTANIIIITHFLNVTVFCLDRGLIITI
jgi:hypothetical protein